MLIKQAGQVDTVWDALFPELIRILPDDLARLDLVLDAAQILKRFEQHWGRAKLNLGRPSIPMATYVRPACGLRSKAATSATVFGSRVDEPRHEFEMARAL